PQLRYSSRLMPRLPATTAFFASIPNPSDFLSQAQAVFSRKMSESPELRAYLGTGQNKLQEVLEKVRAGSEYLGEEIVIFGFKTPDGRTHMPVFLAETKREGFGEFLKREKLPLTLEARNGLVAFGPNQEAVAAFLPSLDAPAGGFQNTPFYSRIDQSYHAGAGLLLAADLGQMAPAQHLADAPYSLA